MQVTAERYKHENKNASAIMICLQIPNFAHYLRYMAKIPSKTLEDLEYPKVLQQLSSYCNTGPGKQLAESLLPISDREKLLHALGSTSEYLSSFVNENRIPNHGFDAIGRELKLMQIENTTLEIASFKKIATICDGVASHKKFFKKFKEY